MRTPIIRLAFALVLLGATLGFPPEGLDAQSLVGPCEVSRSCGCSSPPSISCSSSSGYCSSGPENYGWVECDGVRTYCNAPTCAADGCCNTTTCPTNGLGCDPDCFECLYCSARECFKQCGPSGGTPTISGICRCC